MKTWEQVKSSIASSCVKVNDLTLKLITFIFQFINSFVVQIYMCLSL